MEEGGERDSEGERALTMYLVVLEPLYVVAQQPYSETYLDSSHFTDKATEDG